LKTLDVLQMAVELLRNRGIEVDLSHLPLDDAKTYAMLTKGDTTGVFQLESSGMRDVLRKLHPNRFEDIIALVALYRPGPMDNIPTYIKRKNGEETVEYLHESLQPILEDTFGILIYQEQVMQAAQLLAGYSLGAADLLRRAMGKKKVAEMQAQRANFVKGAGEKHGLSEEQAGMIFDQIDKFAGYGFNKSHAAAYALVAYQTAFLKANYPVEFFAAAMNFELGDTDKLNVFRQELVRNRIGLLPPDINASFPKFTVEFKNDKMAIRYALCAIKGVGEAAMQSVVDVREEKPFRDLFDLSERTDPHMVNRKQWESLAHAGAFDSLNKNRAQVIASIDLLLKHSQQTNAERSSGQANMFAATDSIARPSLPHVKNWDDLTRLQHEFSALGFYMSAHPLDNYRAFLDRIGAVQVNKIAEKRREASSSRVKLAGIVVSKQERTSKQGNKFAFVQLSDGSGAFEITVFSELLAAKRDIMEPGLAVLIEADAQTNTQGGAKAEGAADLRFIARNIEPLSEAAARSAKGVRIKLYEPSPVEDIRKLLASAPKGRTQVVLALELDDGEQAEVELPGSWLLDEALKIKMRQIGDGLEVLEY
ncbi:MAG: DNA polymerase III subunit alpha, partial [Alphaproteobacteria bacterium]|nr:DNA polymerase III subunit alpha [Alphaproteobacteria bacterium]